MKSEATQGATKMKAFFSHFSAAVDDYRSVWGPTFSEAWKRTA